MQLPKRIIFIVSYLSYVSCAFSAVEKTLSQKNKPHHHHHHIGGRWPTGPRGAMRATGATGRTGTTGSSINNVTSYYTANAESSRIIESGQTTISFATQNTNLGSNIMVNGSTITISTNGTYLLSISGIVQEPTREGSSYSYSNNLSFSIGLQEEVSHPFSTVQPYPLAEYGLLAPDEVGGYILTETFSVLHMVKVTNAPVVFNVLLNNS